MADKKYVRVGNFAVKDAFDNKYKSSLPKVIKAAVEKAINGSSKLTTKPPTDKDTTGFSVEGTLTSLSKTDKGNQIILKVQVSMVITTWPEKAMIIFLPNLSSEMQGADPKKLDRDVEDLVRDVVEAAMDKAVPAIESKAK